MALTNTCLVEKPGFRRFGAFVSGLENLVNEVIRCGSVNDKRINAALDGAANTQVRILVSATRLKKDGVYFTDHSLADRLIRSLEGKLSQPPVFFDPTCGAGNLLIAASKTLPVFPTLQQTLESWAIRLHGWDLHPNFTHACRLRLVLEALRRGAKGEKSPEHYSSILERIQTKNALPISSWPGSANVILLNPPYTQQKVYSREWGAGRINMSAVFLDEVLSYCGEDAHIAAILPDVLRSGSRYSRWRKLVASRVCEIETKIIGRFDRDTDIDVFMLSGRRTSNSNIRIGHKWATLEKSSLRTVGDSFKVSVGQFVPHRYTLDGAWRKYLNVADALPWKDVSSISARRRFKLLPPKGPFVVVRRTSNPSDKSRIIGTLINVKEPVLVENHLLVLKPKKGGIKTCRKLLRYIQSNRAAARLNQIIRCRHITTQALIHLPWPE